MAEFMNAIRRGFAGMFRFSGRDARRQFWPYAIFTFLAATLVNYIIMLPELMRMMGNTLSMMAEQRDRGFAPGSEPDPATFFAAIMPNMEYLMWTGMAVHLAAAALLAAAVVRRLHDRDKAGYWGLLPLPMFAIGFALAPMAFDAVLQPGARNTNLMMLSSLTSMASWGLLIYLVVILAQEGSKGPNRYGPEPGAQGQSGAG